MAAMPTKKFGLWARICFLSHMSPLGVANPTRAALETVVPFRLLICVCFVLALCGVPELVAADPRPIVGPGATKDDVIDAYGWPNGSSKSGTREVLSYTQGQVMLENGRVERVDFSMNVPWPAPRPRPGSQSATRAKKPETAVDAWLTNFGDAARDAGVRRSRILALFTGSDWSPASKLFHDEVELHPDFVNAFSGSFVFLRLDFASRASISAETREQNNRLRDRYGVTTYPSLLVLSSSGNVVAVVDLLKEQPGASYRERCIAAVAEVRDLLALRPLEEAETPASTPVPAETKSPERPAASSDTVALASTLFSARWLLLASMLLGVVLVVGVFWVVWRNWSSAPKISSGTAMSERISDAAGGLPSAGELATWPKSRICALIGALSESEGFVAEVQSKGADKDIVLMRVGETQPGVLVCCAPGEDGQVPAKRLRELFGTLTVEGVTVGWYVSPVGFTSDARSYADQHNIRLIDSEWILSRLRDVPPVLVSKLLARTLVGNRPA